MEADYSGPTTNTTTIKINFYSVTIHHKVVLCEHLTLSPVRKGRVNKVTKLLAFAHMESSVFCGQNAASAQPMELRK